MNLIIIVTNQMFLISQYCLSNMVCMQFLRLFFIREFRFTSEVPIWLDYHGKHVAIEQVRVKHALNKVRQTKFWNG